MIAAEVEGKRGQVTDALADPEFAGLSDREVDRRLGVSIGTTSRVRKAVTGAAPDPDKSRAAKLSNARRHGREVPPDVTGGDAPPPVQAIEDDDSDPWPRLMALLDRVDRAADATVGLRPETGQRVECIRRLEATADALLSRAKHLRRG